MSTCHRLLCQQSKSGWANTPRLPLAASLPLWEENHSDPKLIRSPPPPTAADPSNTLQLHLLSPSGSQCTQVFLSSTVSAAQKYPSSCICHSLTAPLYNTGTSTPSNTHDPWSLGAVCTLRVEHLMGSCVDGWIHHTPHGWIHHTGNASTCNSQRMPL